MATKGNLRLVSANTRDGVDTRTQDNSATAAAETGKTTSPVGGDRESVGQTAAKSKVSRHKENLKAYREAGHELPICVNVGCTRFVAVRHWNDGNIPSLKTECGSCASARKKGVAIPGITVVKKHSCENVDSRLGFKCPCDPSRYGEFPSDCYHMDHINGNHRDNRPENIMTLCVMCHTIKGKRDGDFNGSKSSSLRFC